MYEGFTGHIDLKTVRRHVFFFNSKCTDKSEFILQCSVSLVQCSGVRSCSLRTFDNLQTSLLSQPGKVVLSASSASETETLLNTIQHIGQASNNNKDLPKSVLKTQVGKHW